MRSEVENIFGPPSERVIVVADGSKVGRVCLARICALTDIDELVTDGSADDGAIAAIRAAGVAVTAAKRTT